MVKNIREEILDLGGKIYFETQLSDIIVANGFIQGVTLTEKNGKQTDIETDALIASIGHSARDTVEMLLSHGINMMQKPFSVGARIEHPQEFINERQYGKANGHPCSLPLIIKWRATHLTAGVLTHFVCAPAEQ